MRLLVTFWSKNEEWNDLHWVREVFYLWAAQKVTTPCVFLTFFKLYKWYQIAQSVSNFRLVSVDCSLAGGLIAKKRNLSIDDKFGETFKRFLLSHNEIVKSRKLIILFHKRYWLKYPAGNYMFKVSNRNTRTKCQICSKWTINTPERRSGLFIVNFEHILLLVLVFLL